TTPNSFFLSPLSTPRLWEFRATSKMEHNHPVIPPSPSSSTPIPPPTPTTLTDSPPPPSPASSSSQPHTTSRHSTSSARPTSHLSMSSGRSISLPVNSALAPPTGFSPR